MRHDIRDARRGLVRGDGERVLRIHDRRDREAAVHGELLFRFLIRDHAAEVVLGARRRERDDIKHRKGLSDTLRVLHEIPGVAVIIRAERDRLRAVEHRAAADREDEFDAFFLTERHAFPHRLNLGVRGDTAEFHDVAARVREDLLRFVVKPDPLDGPAAVGEQHLLPVTLDQVPEFRDPALAENEVSRKVKVIRLNHVLFLSLFRDAVTDDTPASRIKKCHRSIQNG